MGMDPRYVRRRLEALEKADLITRVRRKAGNGADMRTAYEFAGPIKATALAEQELVEIANTSRHSSNTSTIRSIVRRRPRGPVVRASAARLPPKAWRYARPGN